MSTDDIAQLRAEIARLQRCVDELEAGPPNPDRSRSSRRALLGGAVAGSAALLAGRRVEAGSANGDTVNLGEVNTATQTTEVRLSPDLPSAPRSHVFAAQDGVWGAQVPNATATPDIGTRAAMAGYSGNDAIHGVYGQTNTGLSGASGGRFLGENALSYGVTTAGRRASLRLYIGHEWGTQPPPPSRFDAHHEGEITLDSNDDVWLCVAPGNPGQWRKLGGPATAGAFHPIEPTRVFDSRRTGTPNSGIFAAGSSRVLSVKDGRDPVSGLVTRADVVSTGATAVAYNVTVAQTVGVGFVYVGPGDATTITASTINWSATGTNLANAGIVQLDGDRQVRVFCASNPTHVLIDITGYYR